MSNLRRSTRVIGTGPVAYLKERKREKTHHHPPRVCSVSVSVLPSQLRIPWKYAAEVIMGANVDIVSQQYSFRIFFSGEE